MRWPPLHQSGESSSLLPLKTPYLHFCAAKLLDEILQQVGDVQGVEAALKNQVSGQEAHGLQELRRREKGAKDLKRERKVRDAHRAGLGSRKPRCCLCGTQNMWLERQRLTLTRE